VVFPAKKVHLVGIGGVGMSGVARMLASEGVAVTGSDMRDNPVFDALRSMGVVVHVGHDAAFIPPGVGLIVASAAVKDDNPELVEARRRGIEVIKYARALGLLMAEQTGVAISGTHGKTTTTAMLAWILTRAGKDPSFVVGAHVPDLGTSSREGSSRIFVAEACEYDRSFLNLCPKITVINNIEEDHLDYYHDLADIVSAFREFAALLPPDGLLVVSAHDRNAVNIAESTSVPHQTFGNRIKADWQAENLSPSRGRYTFDVLHDGATLGSASLAIPGVHNVLNALAAIAVAHELGVDFATVADALAGFHGAARRFEIVGEAQGVTIIDDYAHHPTEIQVTLKAARDFFRAGRLWVVFQPHQYSRTRFFLKDFARSFSQADKIIVPDIYFVRDSDEERRAVNAGDLVRELVGLGYDAEYAPDWAAIVDRLSRQVERGDVVITMGAGNVYEVGHDLLQKLRSNS